MAERHHVDARDGGDDRWVPRQRRRPCVGAVAVGVLALAITGCGGKGSPSAATSSATTPSVATSTATTSDATQAPPAAVAGTPNCTPGERPTPEQTEGPYFTPGSPERSDLVESGVGGTTLTLTGFVVATDCRPLAKARVDVWQADDRGDYDNSGYRLRGHSFTDAAGAWKVTTVVPGRYPGRTPHIHVKVTPPGGTELTTQLYFPGEAQNDSDRIYDQRLLVKDFRADAEAATASYTFVVAV